MRTLKINVNKTPEQPNGIEIEVAVPETPLEENMLAYLLPSFLRELKRNERIPYELPEQFQVTHRTEGTFVVTGFPSDAAYYEPPKPIAIVGLRVAGNRFDLIHAAPVMRQQAPAAPAAEQTAPAAAAPAPEGEGQPAPGDQQQ